MNLHLQPVVLIQLWCWYIGRPSGDVYKKLFVIGDGFVASKNDACRSVVVVFVGTHIRFVIVISIINNIFFGSFIRLVDSL